MRPILFVIPGLKLPIFGYGVMVALGFLLGGWTAARRSWRLGIASEHIYDLLVYVVISGIVGARLVSVLLFPYQIEAWWEIFAVWQGGLSFYGGLAAAFLSIVLFARLRRIRLAKLLDVIGPSVALGLGLGRVGCFLRGCCFGRPTGFLFGMAFPPDAPVYQEGGVHYPQPVHPTQLYEAVFALVLYLFLAFRFRRLRHSGEVAATFGAVYGPWRFVIEFVRIDTESVVIGLTLWQVLSVGFFLASLIWLLHVRRRRSAAVA